MKFYKIDTQGKIWLQRLAVPGWGAADEGRILYDTGGNEAYLGDNAGFGKIWTSRNDGVGSGLDADLLDGLTSGNASGNIPVSNGTINANLNAALLNGVDGSSFLTESSDPTLTGDWEFDEPVLGQDPVLNAHLTTKQYVDAQDGTTLTAAMAYADSISAALQYQTVVGGDTVSFGGSSNQQNTAYNLTVNGVSARYKVIAPDNPNLLRLYCYMAATNGSSTAYGRLYTAVGQSAEGSVGGGGPGWADCGTVDVSSWTPGTVYDVMVQGRIASAPSQWIHDVICIWWE